MSSELKILFVEVVRTDTELAMRILTKEGIKFQSRIVETEVDFLHELEKFSPDVIISDFKMPKFDGMRALNLTLEKCPSTPFILLTGSVNEEIAVECMKTGATDYIIKEHIARLPLAIKDALEKNKIILEKEKVELELIKSEERFRSLYENSTIGLYRTTPTGKIILTNPALVKMLGFSSFEELAKRNLQIKGFASSFERKLFLEQIEMDGEVIGLESAWTRKDETVLYVRESARAIRDAKGKILYFDGTVEDITERKKAEEELKESEGKFRSLADDSPNMIFINKNGRVVYVNKKCEEILGYTKDEFLDPKFNFLDLITPEYVELVKENFAKRYQGKAKDSYEYALISKDKRRIETYISNKMINYEGGKAILGIVTDITERRLSEIALQESEDRYRQLVNLSPDAIVVHFEGKFTFLNPAAVKLFGGKNPQDLLGKPIIDFVHPDFRNTVKNRVKKIEEGEIVPWIAEKFLQIDGTSIDVEVAAMPLNYNNKPSVQVVVRDVTQRKRAEDALMDSEDRYRDLVEHSSELFCTHDMEGKILSINASGINIIGYSREEIINTNLRDFIVPEYRDLFDSYLEKINTDGQASGLMIVQNKNGQRKIWEYNNSLRTTGVSTPIVRGMAKDITKQQRAEAEISMLAQALKGVNECVSITDLHDRLIFVNDSFLRTYGYEESELIGKHMTIVRSPNNAHELVSQILPATLHGGWQGELLNKRKDGTEFPIFLSTTTVKDKKGKIIALIGVASDITHRKHAEEILTNERTLLRTIIDLIPDAVFVKDIVGRKILANKKEIEFSGKYSEDEVIGKTDYDLYPESEAKRYSDEDQTVLKSGIPLLNLDGKLIDKQGQIHWLIGAKVPLLDMHGQITGLVGVNHDFTERKQFEDELLKLSRAVEQSPASVVITDPEGYIEYVNTKFCDVSGYSKEEIAGKNSRMLKSGFQNQEFYAELWGKILSGKEWSGEFLNKKKNEEQYWESAQISPVINKEGDITHFVAIKEDITEKKKMIQELIVAKDKAEEMSRLKSNFLANMSHELRTPLNGILGYSEILTTLLEDADQVDLVQGIYQSGKRLSETLKFILDLSEAETGKMEVIAKDVAVVPIIKESVLLFTSEASKKNLQLVTTVKDENIMAHLDAHLLKRILHNLLDNAIKFTKEGTIKVEVGKEVIKGSGKSKKSSTLYIKIKDTGIGIPEDKIDLIWEEFRQVSEGLSRSYEGPGLGLTISKKAVELMHGTLTVESKIGVGSTFTIKFPGILLPSASIESTTDEGDQEESSTKRTKEKSLSASVLYVEDDFINRNMVKLFLKDTCEVDAAEDGTAALKLLKDKKYDLFLVDINLGEGMNGLQLVKEILKIPQYSHTPIIAVTAYAMGKDKEESLQGGCTHYLAKPFRKQEIIDVVNKAMNKS